MPDMPDYWQGHRGGSGQVVVATAIHGDDERTGIFGSIEAAMVWRDTFGEEWSFVFAPYVVDDPDFGNRVNS